MGENLLKIKTDKQNSIRFMEKKFIISIVRKKKVAEKLKLSLASEIPLGLLEKYQKDY